MVPITIVTGANLNQQTSLGGLTLYEIILDSTIYRWSVPLKPLFTSGKSPHCITFQLMMIPSGNLT